MLNRCLYLIAYDVRVPNRLVAALHLTRRYATGGQKSVQECWLTEAEKGMLIADLCQVLEEEDALLVLRLDPRQTVTALGKAVAPSNPSWFYVG